LPDVKGESGDGACGGASSVGYCLGFLPGRARVTRLCLDRTIVFLEYTLGGWRIDSISAWAELTASSFPQLWASKELVSRAGELDMLPSMGMFIRKNGSQCAMMLVPIKVQGLTHI
jgi:hypothetical protein